MKNALERFYQFLDRPLYSWSRVAIVALVIPLVVALGQPLWKISMTAPQYPKGLSLDIYAHTVESGNDNRDLQEINTLNHYIGMKKIDRTELSDLDWIPFALVALILLALRCAAIGNVRMLVDLAVVTAFIGAFSMFRFVYKLYTFGHNLDPTAPFKVEPFTPAIFGSKQIANFHTTSYPQTGSYLIGLFVLGVLGVTAWHLIKGRRDAARADRERRSAIEPSPVSS
jgi:copper chaperone NosL